MQTDKNPTKETYENWYNDSNNWRLGIFYFNKKDKRIFPPKRYGYFGCTINFLNLKSISINFAVIAVIIFLVIYFSNH